MENHFDVIIIGAGAAGLMCAITAANRGRKVVVLERSNKPGKKILMSGGGRCNFTNYHVEPEKYISNNPHFCKSALSRYTQWDFISLVEKHHIPFHEKSLGQLFCDQKSKDIVNMLLAECEAANVTIKLNADITDINAIADHKFKVNTNIGYFQCNSLVIATGGLSIPTMGASPFAYKVAQQFNIKVHPTRAALVPFTLHKKDKDTYSILSGISTNCQVSNDKISFHEDMLFTHRGLSGPAMLQISSYWEPGEFICTNLLPDINLVEELMILKEKHAKIHLKNVLGKHLPNRLVGVFINDMAEMPVGTLSKDQIISISDRFQKWFIKPNQTEGYRTAEVTLGALTVMRSHQEPWRPSICLGCFLLERH